jgi:hypothetical protein
MTTFTTEDRLNAYSHYKIYDENGELMRTVKTKHEAVHLTTDLYRLVIPVRKSPKT